MSDINGGTKKGGLIRFIGCLRPGSNIRVKVEMSFDSRTAFRLTHSLLNKTQGCYYGEEDDDFLTDDEVRILK